MEQQQQATHWQPDLKSWHTVGKESAKLVFDQADKSLKYTIDVANRTTDRAFSLILFLFPLLSVVAGALIAPGLQTAFSFGFRLGMIGIAFAIMGCLGLLITLIFPRQTKPVGRDPRQIATSEWMEAYDQEDFNLLSLYLGEIANMQTSIDYNDAQNAQRTKRLKFSIYSVIGIFIFAVLLVLNHVIGVV